MTAIWNTLNYLIRAFNDLQAELRPDAPHKQPQRGEKGRERERPPSQQPQNRRPKRPPFATGDAGTTVLPYDGVTPDHDDVPYVITNGVLKTWPAGNCIIGNSSGNPHLTVNFATNFTELALGAKLARIRPLSDGLEAVQIESTAGNDVLTIDTTNRKVIPYRICLPLWS